MRWIKNSTAGLKRGIYETDYGNAAYVSGSKATQAYDLDAGEWIPIGIITGKFIRPVESEDIAVTKMSWIKESSEYTDFVKKYYKDHPDAKVGDSETAEEISRLWEEEKSKKEASQKAAQEELKVGDEVI